ncbi:MAG: hypothetical protein J6N54_08725 [Bacteroidales bacterium]|nr:hypothetical protein [Bacteroidales bacterium]
MPKFLVTNGSNFQPFTYDELTRPLYEMAEAKRNTQDQYDALSMQTEALRNYISENEDDKRAKAMYDNYVSKLNALQENLWSHGYTASTRRDLNAARAGFSSDIARLGKAIENRQTRSAEYNKFRHEHPDMVMGSDPGLDGLDNYLDNDLYGTDWYQYSGDKFTAEVAADAGARMKEVFEDPEISQDPRLTGYIAVKKKQGATSEDVAKASAAVLSYLGGDTEAMNGLELVPSILANVLMQHLQSTGAAGKVDSNEFGRLVKYGISGLSASIGSQDTNFLADKQWEKNMQFALAGYQNQLAKDLANYKNNLEINLLRERARLGGLPGGTGAGGNVSDGTIGPVIAALRGNNLNGIATKKEAKELVDKREVYEALSTLAELKRAGGLLGPDGQYVEAARKATDVLQNSKYYNQNAQSLSSDWGAALTKIGNEILESAKNDHYYEFNLDDAGHSNIVKNLFNGNMPELSGKDADANAASIAEYADGKKVSASDLRSIRDAKEVRVGFDAKSGKMTIRRNGSDDSESRGKWSDRIIYLDTDTMLQGAYGADSKTVLEAMYYSLPDDYPTAQREALYNKILNMSHGDGTVDLRTLAKMITSSYSSMTSSNDINKIMAYNSLVYALMQGIYDSSNTPIKPNPYLEGWSPKTGGDYTEDLLGLYSDNEE